MMRNFRFLSRVLIGAFVCCSFAACSDDDNNNKEPITENGESGVVNPTNVFTNGIPVQVDGMEIKCDANGLITEMTDGRETIRFRYLKDMTRAASEFDIEMTINDEGESGEDKFYIQLNEAGFAKYCKQIEGDGDVEQWWFGYNNDGQLNYMKRSEGGNEVTNITYANGDITKVSMRSEDDGEGGDWTIEYATPAIANKGCLMLFDDNFGIDMDEMKYAYFAGLLGKATKNLPSGYTNVSIDRDTDKSSFDWTLNENGFPTKLVITEIYSGGSYENQPIFFVW